MALKINDNERGIGVITTICDDILVKTIRVKMACIFYDFSCCYLTIYSTAATVNATTAVTVAATTGCNIGCKTLYAERGKLPLKLTWPSGASQGLVLLAPLPFFA